MRICAPGERIFSQGDLGDALYIVVHGGVELRVQVNSPNSDPLGTVVAVMRSGDDFGEWAIMDDKGVRSATARAQSGGCARIMARCIVGPTVLSDANFGAESADAAGASFW
jgi:CRP-like cAMP-binding protein